MRVLSVVLCVCPACAIHRFNVSLHGSSPPEKRATPSLDSYDHLSAEAAMAAHNDFLASLKWAMASEGAAAVGKLLATTARASWNPCNYSKSKLVVWWRQGVFQDKAHRNLGYPDCDVTCVEAGSQEECGQRADAIVYHLPSVGERAGGRLIMEGAGPEFKGKFSIGMMMESAKKYPVYGLENITGLGYDMTATTSLASDLPVLYMNDFSQFDAWGKRSVPGFHERLPAVAFMARGCGDRGELVSKLADLQIPVHSLGGCVPNGTANKHTHDIRVGDKVRIISKYRVYLAFENSIEPGYVTEKVYDGYKAGCVGVYSGAPDIGRFVPPGSIIKISKDTVADAAVKIKEALYNENAWNRLNWWRRTPVSEWQGGNFLRSWGAPGETPPAGFHGDLGCRICRAAYAHKYPDEARFNPKTQTLEMLTRAA